MSLWLVSMQLMNRETWILIIIWIAMSTRNTTQTSLGNTYHKQQILRGTKLLRFSRIFDKTRKLCLLISMAHSNMYCNLTKPRRFSLHYSKNQWTTKVLYRGGFVVYGITNTGMHAANRMHPCRNSHCWLYSYIQSCSYVYSYQTPIRIWDNTICPIRALDV